MPTPTPAEQTVAHSVEELIRHRLSTALGGWRGSLETALPTIAFIGVWTWRQDLYAESGPALRQAVWSAVAVAVVLAVLRLIQRSSLQHVFGAVIATALAAFFAMRSGRAEDAFLPGMLLSGAYLVGTLISILARWPVVGFLVGAGDPRAAEDPFGWRRDSGMVRVCSRLTWVLVALYAVRLSIQIPLYLAGQVAALGVAKILLGWPLWVAGVAVMGWMLVRGNTPQEIDALAHSQGLDHVEDDDARDGRDSQSSI
ncbi:membrane protein [Knoellia sinensis KCTC 19936]|uniref:Membrane protein n=1 Tax=Knoellia sinensis KCTC 19936 TaxID=1385520 RepID=A0A0A0JB32_9MICO|nr:DUF3159 domain-containing protein [Knoellia sinensis]KGN33237.1 membrane protein [Knoellia sinensis KCTC 19936]